VSDIEKRRAILEEFSTQCITHGLPGVTHMIAGHNGHAMADEIIRLRAENAALTAAVGRVRALHPDDDQSFCYRCRVVSPCRTLRALEGTP
jgi:hypothetical protein